MLRSRHFACVSAGLAAGWLAAGWLLVAACSETGSATAPLPDGTSPTQSPFPNRPNRDVLLLPGALNPAYQIDDNGVMSNGASQGDDETPPDEAVAGAEAA